jgi:hypothetical protein
VVTTSSLTSLPFKEVIDVLVADAPTVFVRPFGSERFEICGRKFHHKAFVSALTTAPGLGHDAS